MQTGKSQSINRKHNMLSHAYSTTSTVTQECFMASSELEFENCRPEVQAMAASLRSHIKLS
jgi:hypothetical protein